VRVRTLSAAAVVALAVTGLSACRTNVGAAAVVGGHRITESEVQTYLTPEGPTAAAVAQAAQNNQPLYPKSIALNTVVQSRVYAATLTGMPGGLPSDAELHAAHDQAAQTLTGGSITGAQFDAEVAASLGGEGLRQKLLPLVIRNVDLEYALIVRTKATSAADVAKAIAAQHISVSVNPAYGSWNAATYGVAAPGSKVPDFLTLKSTAVTPAG